MNIPPEVARSQGEHGIKGAAHGIKGGRPRLDLTDEERTERRRQQQEAWRRRNGIPPKKAILTWEERQERNKREHQERWNEEYRGVWSKLPGETLTAGEFKNRYPAFRAWVRACQARHCPLHESVDFVRRHFREERQRQRAGELQSPDAGLQRAAARKTQALLIQKERQRSVPFPFPVAATPSVGRNQPCPCGSGRKFKKCCGP